MGRIGHQRSEHQASTEFSGAEDFHCGLRAKTNRIKELLPLIPECGQVLLSILPGQLVEVPSGKLCE
jgi:hypothetical protein